MPSSIIMKVALIIPVHNRPEYLQQCLASISRTDLPKDLLLILVNDASTDNKAIELFNSFELKGAKIERYHYEKNQGIRNVLLFAFDHCFNNGIDICINLDSDAIVRRDFFTRLLALHGDSIVSGFNCNNPKNPILKDDKDHVSRQHCNGINMCMNKAQYEKIVRPALLKDGNWDFNSTNKKPFVITKPSVVQHIGMVSSMGHNINPDVACDFYTLDLPTVTLFGVDAHDPEGLKRAAEICTREVKFGDVKIITERLFSGREAYSKFCIKDMAKYIETEHVLIIHPDGYIQNPLAWDDSWLQWDYIGATWGYKDGMNVGNGGFCLRSKKLLDIISKLELTGHHPEDDWIARKLRPMLEKEHGIRFAPEEVANKFSIEAYGSHAFTDTWGNKGNKYSGQFGFHSYNVVGLPIPPLPRNSPISRTIRIGTKPQLTYGRKIK